jgi:UDP-N-acetylglucosamine--N-acetylmuramyl-(pentapeptide) pyrophosphoryl-undecaprenol N-acetylglucosamine transferase
MANKNTTYRIMISGGGTGGHIFPAVAVAEELKRQYPTAEILFVGALGKMEMQKVPEAGFNIVGLPIRGLQRRLTPKNLLLPFYILRSLWKAFSLLSSFKPQAVIGFGGYASAPLLFAASLRGIPVFIQEQNSYAGLANKVLAKRAKKICVAYDDMQKFFPANNIVFTGNPIRLNVLKALQERVSYKTEWNLNSEQKVLLVIGGSLGAKTINRSIASSLLQLKSLGLQIIWQTGVTDFEAMSKNEDAQVKVVPFIKDMYKAYASADIIVSRAGAIAVSELAIVGKPVVLIPSPNVTEDHQTKNAMALVKRNAAAMVKDINAEKELLSAVADILTSSEKQKSLTENIVAMARPNAAKDIVNIVLTEINR